MWNKLEGATHPELAYWQNLDSVTNIVIVGIFISGGYRHVVDCSSTRCVCKSASSEDVRKASRAVLPVRRASYAQPPDAVARHLGPSGNNPFTLQIPAGDETPQVGYCKQGGKVTEHALKTCIIAKEKRMQNNAVRRAPPVQ